MTECKTCEHVGFKVQACYLIADYDKCTAELKELIPVCAVHAKGKYRVPLNLRVYLNRKRDSTGRIISPQ